MAHINFAKHVVDVQPDTACTFIVSTAYPDDTFCMRIKVQILGKLCSSLIATNRTALVRSF